MRTDSLLTSALLFAITSLLLPHSGSAQPLTDTTFTWEGYARTATCHLRIYPTPADEKRQQTVVLQEVASNEGPSTVSDLSYLVEEVARRFELDPTKTYWIVHWGAFSYETDQDDDRELFLRATFRRTSTRRLSSPRWDVATRNEVSEYTDRRFQ